MRAFHLPRCMVISKLYVFTFSHLHPPPLKHLWLNDFQANILVSRDGIAKLSDFDHSIMAENSLVFSETSRLGGGTTRWMVSAVVDEPIIVFTTEPILP